MPSEEPQEFVQSVVPSVQLAPHETAGEDVDARSAPYWVRGRDHETAHVMSTLTKRPCAISIIAGSPGSGKSTMLTHIGAYLRAKGINTVELRREDISNEITLTNALLQVNRARQATRDNSSETRGGDLEQNAVALNSRQVSSKSGTSDAHGPLTWRLALQELGKGEGTVILVDEMQRLEELHKESKRAELAADLMNELHSNHMRQPNRKVVLLGFGLSNTRDVLNGFHLIRVENNHVVRMGPLSPAASKQILRDHCEAKTLKGEDLIQPPENLLDEMVEVSGGCAHHLAWAGCRIQQRALDIAERGDQEWTDGDSVAVRDPSERDRMGLYSSRLPTDDEPQARALAFTLATAVEKWGRALPKKLVEAANEAIRSDDAQGRQLIHTLLFKGIIELREAENQFLTLDLNQPHTSHYAFPTHSMAKWLRNSKQMEAGETWTRADSERVLAEISTPLESIGKIPEWQWNHEREQPRIPRQMRLPEAGIDATEREEPKPQPVPRRSLINRARRWMRRKWSGGETVQKVSPSE